MRKPSATSSSIGTGEEGGVVRGDFLPSISRESRRWAQPPELHFCVDIMVSLTLATWAAECWFLPNNFLAVHLVQAMVIVLDVWMEEYGEIRGI